MALHVLFFFLRSPLPSSNTTPIPTFSLKVPFSLTSGPVLVYLILLVLTFPPEFKGGTE